MRKKENLLPKKLPSCSKCGNKHCAFQMHLSPKWLEYLDSKKTSIRYLKRNTVIREWNLSSGCYVINKGKVCVVMEGVKNEHIIVDFASCDDILWFPKHQDSISLITIEETLMGFIEEEDFQHLLANNKSLLLHLLKSFHKKIQETYKEIWALSQLSVREKIVHYLLKLDHTFGKETNGHSTIDVQLHRKDLAQIVGTTVPQISRNFSLLQEDNLVKWDNKRISILEKEKLASILPK